MNKTTSRQHSQNRIATPQTKEDFKKRFSFKNNEKSIDTIPLVAHTDQLVAPTPQTNEAFKTRFSF